MNLLTPLSNLLLDRRSSPEADLADRLLTHHGLTRPQLAALRTLWRSTEQRQALLAALDARLKLLSEGLLSPDLPADQATFLRGRLAGLRELPLLVDEILARAEDLTVQDERRRHNARADRDALRALRAFSPFWGADAGGDS